MLFKIILLGLLALAVQGEDSCFSKVEGVCSADGGIWNKDSCNPHYSGVLHVKDNLQKYAEIHISQNFQYLLMSSYFKNYIANREGFSKLYRKLSDDAWEDSIDLIKYMAKRGFNMNYEFEPVEKMEIASYRMDELSSLAAALERQKFLAEEGHKIHKQATHHSAGYHDAELMHYIEEEFAEKHASTVRNLAGHVNDLHDLVKANKDPSLAVYLFDEYLSKAVS